MRPWVTGATLCRTEEMCQPVRASIRPWSMSVPTWRATSWGGWPASMTSYSMGRPSTPEVLLTCSWYTCATASQEGPKMPPGPCSGMARPMRIASLVAPGWRLRRADGIVTGTITDVVDYYLHSRLLQSILDARWGNGKCSHGDDGGPAAARHESEAGHGPSRLAAGHGGRGTGPQDRLEPGRGEALHRTVARAGVAGCRRPVPDVRAGRCHGHQWRHPDPDRGPAGEPRTGVSQCRQCRPPARADSRLYAWPQPRRPGTPVGGPRRGGGIAGAQHRGPRGTGAPARAGCAPGLTCIALGMGSDLTVDMQTVACQRRMNSRRRNL